MKQKQTLLSRYLRKKRLEVGLTQRDLGNLLGYKPQFITNWERGASSPPAKIMNKLVKTLKIREDEILEILAEESMRYWSEMIRPKKNQRKRA